MQLNNKAMATDMTTKTGHVIIFRQDFFSYFIKIQYLNHRVRAVAYCKSTGKCYNF